LDLQSKLTIAVVVLQALGAISLVYFQYQVNLKIESVKEEIEKRQVVYPKLIDSETELMSAASPFKSWPPVEHADMLVPMTKEELVARIDMARSDLSDTRRAIVRARPVVPPAVRETLDRALVVVEYMQYEIRQIESQSASDCTNREGSAAVCGSQDDFTYNFKSVRLYRNRVALMDEMAAAIEKLQKIISRQNGEQNFSSVISGWRTFPFSMDCGSEEENLADDDGDGMGNCNDLCPWSATNDTDNCSNAEGLTHPTQARSR
jgi:hypothetical protein